MMEKCRGEILRTSSLKALLSTKFDAKNSAPTRADPWKPAVKYERSNQSNLNLKQVQSH